MTSTDDKKLINEIVDKLKKQGIFDQFRKECLADVDTKPAYQNLTHRVDGFVNNFLSQIQWSPDLNKNQLRDQLRRQLTQSQILSSGVERVVDQTVNPKIYKVFKPKVDVIICEYLGIDPKLREEKLKYKAELEHRRIQQEQQQQQQKQQPPQQPPPPGFTSPIHIPMMGQMGTPGTPGAFGVPNLMEINFSYPPPPLGSPTFGSPLGIPQMSSPIQIPGYPNMLTSYPSPWNAMGSPYRPPTISSVAMVPNVPGYGLTVSSTINKSPKVTPTKLDPSIMQAIQGQPAALEEERRKKEKEEKERRKEKEREKLEPLTVESLLNVPVPKQTEPKERKERRSDPMSSAERAVTNLKFDDVKREKIEYKDENSQPLEGSPPARQPSDTSLPYHDSDSKPDISKLEDGGESKPAKKFHFAWDNLLDEVEVGVSDVTVSSVHTSDLSSFEEDLSSFDDEPLSPAEEATSVTPAGSPEKQPTVPSTVSPEKTKQRRLIALQYNYSDSDDDETREERKARIAKEKEERYLRRQQRRAELEAKRKERVTEKAVEQPTEAVPEQQVSGSDAATGPSETEMSSPIKRRGRKTKEELKQQLRDQKVLEKKMALRRQRRRNPKFVSDEYVSIFSERKSLMAEDFMDADEQVVVEEQVMTTDMTDSVDYTHGIVLESPPTPTQDERSEVFHSSQEFKQDSETPVLRSRRRHRQSEGSRSGSRATTPASDISESSNHMHDTKRRSRRSRNEDFDALETSSTRSNDSDRPSQRYSDNDLYKPRTSYGRNRQRQSTSQASRSYSPVPRGQSSPPRSRSPTELSMSPRGRPYSPMGRSRSPAHQSRSPSRNRSFSPDDDSRSPVARRRHSSESRSPSPMSHRHGPSSPSSPTPSIDKEGIKITRVGRKSRRAPPSPPPLDESKGNAQRYTTSDLYKPHNPSTRATRYLSRASPEHKPAPVPPPAAPSEADEGSDDGSNRPRTPVDLVDFGEAAKRNKKPVDKINFGLAARHSTGVVKHPPHSPQPMKHTPPHVKLLGGPSLPKHPKYTSNELDFGEAARSVRRDSSMSATLVQVPGRPRLYTNRQPQGRGRPGASPVVAESRMSPLGATSPRGMTQVRGSVSPRGRASLHGVKVSTHPLVTPGPGRTPRSYHSDRECSQESDRRSWTRQSSNDEDFEEYEEVAYAEEYESKKHRRRSYSREYSYEGKEGSSRDYEDEYEVEPPRSPGLRRSHSDEGDLEGAPEEIIHEYVAPRNRSNSPEEGEIDAASPEDATSSPEVRILASAHSPDAEPSPPLTRRYRSREDEPYARLAVEQGIVRGDRAAGQASKARGGLPRAIHSRSQEMTSQERETRAGSAAAAAAPMVTRATRRRSEDEHLPPSKRLRRYNQN